MSGPYRIHYLTRIELNSMPGRVIADFPDPLSDFKHLHARSQNVDDYPRSCFRI